MAYVLGQAAVDHALVQRVLHRFTTFEQNKALITALVVGNGNPHPGGLYRLAVVADKARLANLVALLRAKVSWA